MMHRSLVCLALAAAGAVPAAASSPARLPVGGPVTISTADLDLTTVAGRARLDRRIARTAERLCAPPYPALHSATVTAAYEACLADTIAAAAPLRETAIAAQRDRTVRTASVTP